MSRAVFVLATLLVLGLVGCAGPEDSEEGILIEDAWVRPNPMEGGNGAAYMVIRNLSDQDDRLISVSTDIVSAAEIHMTTAMEGGAMGMQHVEGIPVPAGGQAVLEPGGYHIMLIAVQEELQPGQMVTLTLLFEQAGEVTVVAEVREE